MSSGVIRDHVVGIKRDRVGAASDGVAVKFDSIPCIICRCLAVYSVSARCVYHGLNLMWPPCIVSFFITLKPTAYTETKDNQGAALKPQTP